MASKPETTFYTSVHKHLPPLSKLYRVKMSNPYVAGIADHWYSGTKADLWIEWKFITPPKRDETVINLCGGKKPIISALQQDWIEARSAEGRNVWVIVGCRDGGMVFRGCSWRILFTAKEFRRWIKQRAEIAAKILNHTGCRP